MLATKDTTLIGDSYLLLAHDVLEYAERYAKVFSDPLFEECNIILDNSVIELGSSVSAETLLKAADIVNANVIAMPDVLLDGPETFKASLAFYESLIEEDKFRSYMFIPQGKTFEEWCNCLELAFEHDLPLDWIGIARNTTNRIVHSRKALVAYASTLEPGAQIHLLGFSDNPQDDITTIVDMGKHIASIDSAVPVRYPGVYTRDSADPGPRGDWWEKAEWSAQVAENIMCARSIFEEDVLY